MADKPQIPSEMRNSTEPQHFGGVPGLYIDGKLVKEEDPKPISELIDESKLKPGEVVPTLPQGTHIASEADLAPDEIAPPDEPEPPQEAKK